MRSLSPTDLAIAGLVHDLNNVLQTILHASDPIASDPRHAEAAQSIARSVEQGRRLLDALQPREPVPLADAIGNALGFVRDYLCQSGPVPRFVVEADPALLSRKVPPAIERAFMNLFVNAAALAQDPERPCTEIRIGARIEAAEAVITVSDDGPGIPDALLRAIFIPRFSARSGGEGLGLHVVESAVNDCGGSIAASNSAAGGAVFTIRLPAVATSTGISGHRAAL